MRLVPFIERSVYLSIDFNRSLRTSALLVCIIGILLQSGCDLLRVDRPETVRVVLEGKEGASIRVITSSAFFSQRVPIFDAVTGVAIGDSLSVILAESDTLTVLLPFEASYSIRETEKFYVNLFRLSPEDDALYSRIWVDEDLRMDKRTVAEENPVVFVYDFRNASDGDPDTVF